MDDLLVSAATQRQIEAMLRNSPHALLLSGRRGSGKGVLARSIAAKLLDLPIQKLGSYAYITFIEPEKDTISVEQARGVIGLMRLRTTGERQLRRIVIIEQADTMTREAQNALLKTLEEPPVDTCIILTVSDKLQLLPTILSRTQQLEVQPATEIETEDYFALQGYDSAHIHQALLLSGGLPGLMQALLADDTGHPLVQSVETAKALLAGTTFERLAQVDAIVKQKQQRQIVEALIRIADVALAKTASRSGSDEAIKRWSAILRAAVNADRDLRASGQAKLVMTNLFLQM